MSGALVEMTLWLHTETDMAWGVSVDGDEEQMVWIPKSQGFQNEKKSKKDPIYEFAIPEWLAEKEDLL